MESKLETISILNKKESNHFQIISISVDPERDTPDRLKEYMQAKGIDQEIRSLLVGNHEQVFRLSKETFHSFTLKDEIIPNQIFHDERFILVDKLGKIRGFYPYNDNIAFQKLIKDIKYLIDE